MKLHITITDITELKLAEMTWLDRCQHLERELKTSQVELKKKKTEIADIDAVLSFVIKQQETEISKIKLALSKGVEDTLLPIINKLKKCNEK